MFFFSLQYESGKFLKWEFVEGKRVGSLKSWGLKLKLWVEL